jgi:hypothetical protein
MRLRPTDLLILFAVGAAGGLIGDAGNVQSGATLYLDDSGPFVWESPLWFPVLVGAATVATGVVRLRLGPPRPGFDVRIGLAAFASVVAIYSVTSVAGDDGTPAVALVFSLGVLVACFLADRPGVICGLIAAVIGPLAEIAIVGLDLSEYTDPNDSLFGVGLWLPGLYLAFGVAAARIAELLVARRTG